LNTAICLLAGTAILLNVRNKTEIVPVRESFASFPQRVASWVGSDANIPTDVLRSLGPGDFLNRDYHEIANGDDMRVSLFIGYFPSQRAGDTLHSPKNCLPGSGWVPVESGKMEIRLHDRAPFVVNRYLIVKGSERGLALYWYWAHGRSVANEYWAKFYLVKDSIYLNRSDGSLIRVTTQLGQHENPAAAERRLISFLNAILGTLEPYLPR